MKPHQPDQAGDLKESLTRLEQTLETPIVPGELRPWLEDALQAFLNAGYLYRREVEETHRELFDKLCHHDMALAVRVEQMKDSDAELLANWNRLDTKLVRLCDAVLESEHQDAELPERATEFSDQAIKLIIDVRKHEAKLVTWYLESLNRDRGLGD
jgi:hypothetical protein